MPGLSAEDFTSWPRWRGPALVANSLGRQTEGTSSFVSRGAISRLSGVCRAPVGLSQAAADRFKVFLWAIFWLSALGASLGRPLRPFIGRRPEISNLCIVLRRAPHPFDPIDDPLRISVGSLEMDLSHYVYLQARGRRAGRFRIRQTCTMPRSWIFRIGALNSFHRILAQGAQAMRSRWQNLLIDRLRRICASAMNQRR